MSAGEHGEMRLGGRWERKVNCGVSNGAGAKSLREIEDA